ncbi:hypothetical protein AX17_007322 [Amanita inopinata Kibby_2008]|nr:hypothetical protein AX17_007322 [Amanita inopinata Kibby_2008]
MAKVNLLFTGATGYVGSSVLSAFLDHPQRESLNITALVRNAEKAEKLKAFGINVVVGDHTDAVLFEKLASETDYLFGVADADNLAVAQAALNGLKKRFQATGVAPAFIHISGTGVLADDAKGKFSEVVYHDDDPAHIETLDPKALHRDVELLLVAADKEGYVKTYIVSPPTIWGRPQNKLAKAGFTHTLSIQVPALIKVSLARGSGSYVGDGKNIWDNVNVDDLGIFYTKLFDHVRSNSNAAHGREGFYFARADEHSLYDVGKGIAVALHSLGKVKSPEPTAFKQEELDQFFGGFQRYFGCNARARGNRALATGWKPTKTTKDFLAGFKEEAEAVLASM